MSNSAPGLDEAKRLSRQQLRQARTSLPRAQRRAAETRITDALASHLLGAQRVGLYASAYSEVSLDDLATHLGARGVALAWPRVDGHELFFHYAELGDLTSGFRGLREPEGRFPACDIATLDALLVPGVGFDRAGRRLGQGGGFYDRILAQHPRLNTIGVAFRVQLIDDLPSGPDDERVRHVVTEDGFVTPPA